MSLRFYYLSSEYEVSLFMVTDFTTKFVAVCWTTLRSFPAPDFERMVAKRSLPRERDSNSDCFNSFDHYEIDFITYFNLV